MCIIAVCKDRGLTESEIKRCFSANGDGAGMCWNSTESIIKWRKGFMKVEHLLDAYFDEKINEIVPHVLHFRKASNSVTQKLTHPFVVSKESLSRLIGETNRPLLFHNGFMNNWRTTMLNYYISNGIKVPEGVFSDSRFIAILVNKCGPEILTLLEDKFVYVTAEQVRLFGNFTDEDGVLFSNTSYKTGSFVSVGGQKVTTSKYNSNGGDIAKTSPMSTLIFD